MSVEAGPVFGERLPGRTVVPRPSAYGLVQNEHQEFAIVHTRRGLFLPGGGIERWESAEDAVMRETFEECGLIVVPRREVARAVQIVHAKGKELTFEKASSFWWSELVERAGQPEPGSELVWLLASEAVEKMFHESQAWVLRRYTGSAKGGDG